LLRSNRWKNRQNEDESETGAERAAASNDSTGMTEASYSTGRCPVLLVGLMIFLLLLPGGTVAAAEAPTEPAIVLRLPPTVTPDEVKQLVSDLAAKGATTVPPATVSVADQDSLAARVANRLVRAAPAAGRFLELRKLWAQAMAQEGQAAGGMFLLALAGLIAAALLVEFLIRIGLRALLHSLQVKPGSTLFSAFGRHALAVGIGVIGFLIVMRSGMGFLGNGSPLLTGIASHVADGTADWRIAMGVLTALAAPGIAPARPLLIDDHAARAITHWISIYLVSAVILVTGVWVAGRLGGDDMTLLAGLGAGIALLVYKIVMFFRLRSPVAAAILAAGGGLRATAWKFAAASWHWVFIGLSTLVFLLALEEFVVGNNPRAAAAATALQTVIVGFALIWAAKRRFVIEDVRLNPGRWWLTVASRTLDVVLLLGSALWLARLFGYDVLSPTGGAGETVLRPIFKAATTLSVAWLIWVAIRGFLGERMPQQAALVDEDVAPSEPAGMTRLATLLPLIRTAIAIATFFLGVVIALGDLGVNIGPLLAGAGVVGIALGFGAQALVRDVIAGVFFLIDDAFRLGEYIDTGRLKGTVEAISIRSVRLRHQNGQVHTIPFGLIQAVTNSSRDWAIVKFNLHVLPEADLELVRKTLKQLGRALQEDPAIGGDFIQPLKMQGVADVTQAAIMIRCKFTARPVRPSYLRRQAMREIIKRFAAAGIAFATPPANASNPA
jgi:small-conductance mechanosensitive channel